MPLMCALGNGANMYISILDSTLARFHVIHALHKGETIKRTPVAKFKRLTIKSTIGYCAINVII